MTNEGNAKTVTFTTLRVGVRQCGHIIHMMKMFNFIRDVYFMRWKLSVIRGFLELWLVEVPYTCKPCDEMNDEYSHAGGGGSYSENLYCCILRKDTYAYIYIGIQERVNVSIR